MADKTQQKNIIPKRMAAVQTQDARAGKRLVTKRAKDVAQSLGLTKGLPFATKPE